MISHRFYGVFIAKAVYYSKFDEKATQFIVRLIILPQEAQGRVKIC